MYRYVHDSTPAEMAQNEPEQRNNMLTTRIAMIAPSALPYVHVADGWVHYDDRLITAIDVDEWVLLLLKDGVA